MKHAPAAARPQTHYATLGVPEDASVAIIEATFRLRSIRARMGLGGRSFCELVEARRVLTDKSARAEYDQQLRTLRTSAS